MRGEIVTFYSYKGGTGRTMALANVACLLAANGQRVLAIDWDLEAPGLHRYLHPFLDDPDLETSEGLIDLVWSYTAAFAHSPDDNLDVDPLSLADPEQIAVATRFEATGKRQGSLHFIGAGCQATTYADRVRNFSWSKLFSHGRGTAFIQAFGERCRESYDVTLIDSRTGIADVAGITTVLLPDKVVLCFTANRQSVLGVRAVGESILAARPKLPLLPVVMRVEKGVEGWRDVQDFYQGELSHLLPNSSGSKTHSVYWGASEILHYPNYALAETLAVFNDKPEEQNSLLSDMRRLTTRIVEKQFMSEHSLFPAPSFSDEVKASYANRIRFRDPRIAELERALDGDPVPALERLSAFEADTRLDAVQNVEWGTKLAQGFENVARKFARSGDRDKAEIAAREAVNIWRTLADLDDRYAAQLATALDHWAYREIEIGAADHALISMREAVELYRGAAARDPARYESSLAGCLSNLSACLGTAGLRVEAVEAAREAVDMRRRLADANPERYAEDLAAALTNLSSNLSEIGEVDESLKAIREVIDIRRRLAAGRSPRHKADLATGLNNLALDLLAIGSRAEAVQHLNEALQIRRDLAAENPRLYQPDLALTLYNASAVFRGNGDYQLALETSQEAVTLFRKLYREHPNRFGGDLAAALSSSSVDASDLSDYKWASDLAQEAVSILRPLAERNPTRYQPELASALINFAAAAGRNQEYATALRAHEEAIRVYRHLVAVHAGRYRRDLASALADCANTLTKEKHLEAAFEMVTESLALWRELAIEHPTSYGYGLFRAQIIFASVLAEKGDVDRAVEVGTAAADGFRVLARETPAAYLPDLAVAIAHVAKFSMMARRLADAIAAMREAIGVRRVLTSSDPRRFGGELAASLGTLGAMLVASGDDDEARKVVTEAVVLLNQLERDSPGLYSSTLEQANALLSHLQR